VQVVASLPLLIYANFRHWTGQQATDWSNGAYVQFAYVAIAEALTVSAVWWLLRVRGLSLRDIGWHRFRASSIVYALAGFGTYFVAYAVLLAVASSLVPSLNVNQQQDIGFQQVAGAGQLIVTFLSLVVLPPLAEETLFRGFLFTSFRRRMSFLVATLLTSALFAVPHLLESQGSQGLLWVAGIDTFVLSLVLCFLREKSDSLWPGILLHGLKNGIAFVSLFLLHSR
jgi:membrane protease YdiL (CAAX protease family)